MNQNVEAITQAEAARRIGKSPQWVHKLIGMGRLKKVGRKVTVESVEREIRNSGNVQQNSEHHQPGLENHQPVDDSQSAGESSDGSSVEGEPDYWKEKARHERAKATQAELDLEAKRGNLVDANEVRREAFNLARELRDGILAIPDRLADVLAAETKARVVHEKLTDELTLVLEEVSENGPGTNPVQ